MSARTCKACEVPLAQRIGESLSKFKRRDNCGRSCANRGKSKGKLIIPAKTCACGKVFSRRDGEEAKDYRRRKYCGECGRHRPRQAFKTDHRCANPDCAKIMTPRSRESPYAFQDRKTCSNECRYACVALKLKTLPVKDCARCGASFKASRGSWKAKHGKRCYEQEQRFCSHECATPSAQMLGPCAVCGLDVVRQKHYKHKSTTCSPACRIALRDSKRQAICSTCFSVFLRTGSRKQKHCSPGCVKASEKLRNIFGVLLSVNEIAELLDISYLAAHSRMKRLRSK